jgi:hypothetical protein
MERYSPNVQERQESNESSFHMVYVDAACDEEAGILGYVEDDSSYLELGPVCGNCWTEQNVRLIVVLPQKRAGTTHCIRWMNMHASR